MESALALITVGIGFAAMIITIIIGLVILVKQGNRHDSEIASLRAELLTEMRTLGDRIENRVALGVHPHPSPLPEGEGINGRPATRGSPSP